MTKALMSAAAAVALLVGACGGGDSLAGTYDCGPDEPEPVFPHETWELREDGTFVIEGPPPGAGAPEGPPPGAGDAPAGTWSVEGDSLVFTLDGQEERLTIQGDGFRSEPGEWPIPPDEEVRFVCTRTT